MTEIRIAQPDGLTITAYSITPQGEEAKAIEAKYRRKQLR